jgi:hypothetical protein
MGDRFNGGPVYGGTFPALIFHDYMAAALAAQPVADLPGSPAEPLRRAGRVEPPPSPEAGPLTTFGRLMAYQRPFLATTARVGLLATTPASVSFLLATLVVSALWRDPGGGHRLVAACCAWRATDLPRGPLLPLVGSAFLVRRPVEAVWTVAATWLVLGPLEAVVGSRRLLAVAALGHVVPTVLVDLCWLAGGLAGQGLGGLDVGTSAVVVTTAAALAVTTRSLPVVTVLAARLAVDIAAAPDLATAEHLIAVAIGAGFAMAFSRHRQGAGAPPPQEPATSLQRLGSRWRS